MIIRKYVQSLRKNIGAHCYIHNLTTLPYTMKVATQYCKGQELIFRNINYIEEIEDQCHQINLLKLG